MGIKNLFKFLRKYANAAITEVSLDDLKSSKVAIDMSIYIYQFHSVALSHNIVNVDGKYINHIQGTLHKLSLLLRNDIQPICVFDGSPPAAKAPTIANRKKLHSMNNVFADVKTLVKLMGVPIVNSPSEAEAECAYLNKQGIVDYVITEDLDALVFGADRVIKNLKATGGILIDRQKILEILNINQDQFIHLCLSLGSDYTNKSTISITKAYTQMGKLTNETVAFDLFKNPQVTSSIEFVEKKDEKLYEFLYEVHKLSPTKTKKSLAPITAELFIW